uniref:procollagen-proline 4-dioxygenase n=1 Tax=Cacopsylla melanoneura TaxID=428564 RepID=A0A8D8LH18_9HEMI
MNFVKLLLLLTVQTRWSSIFAAQGRTVYSALNTMMETLVQEQKLLKAAEYYAARRADKLKIVTRIHERWKQVHKETRLNLTTTRSDPMTNLKLIQRITSLWPELKNSFLNRAEERRALSHAVARALVPDVNDIRGFTRLLVVNAVTYEKSFDEILNVRTPFVSLDDFLELSFRVKYHDLGTNRLNTLTSAVDLAYYGLLQYEDTTTGDTDDTESTVQHKPIQLTKERWDLLSSLTDDLNENGFWEGGYTLCKAILQLFPDDDEFIFKVEMFKDKLQRKRQEQDILRRNITETSVVNKVNPDKELYAKLCRRKRLILPTRSDLKCYYVHLNSHLRHIAAYKMEEVSRSPLIRIYHDVIHDGEIELMKSLTTPHLNSANVFNPDAGVQQSEDRISNNAWLYDPDRYPIISGVPQPPEQAHLYRVINKRLEDCTGLNGVGTEGFQVNNYGIGGHYLWHYDSLYYNDKSGTYKNDRLATWMFYLNDVVEGGNTVFTRLNIAIPPMKGAAVFWYNLHPSGLNDFRTLHAGCPILQGTKWVTNLWIGEFEQIFHKPCLKGADRETSSPHDIINYYEALLASM